MSKRNDYIQECLESYWEALMDNGGNARSLLFEPDHMSSLVYDADIDPIIAELEQGTVDLSSTESKVAAIYESVMPEIEHTVIEWQNWLHDLDLYSVSFDFSDADWRNFEKGPTALETLADFVIGLL
jgi:hypothetical protein